MSKIIIHDGAASIGGNKIELRDAGARLLFDFGLNMKTSERYFASQDTPRAGPGSIDQALFLGILPRPEVFGKESYCAPVDGPSQGLPKVSAIFLTHAHGDHQGCIPYLDPAIPIYATPATACLFSQKYVRKDYEPKIEVLKEKVTIGQTKVDFVPVDHSIPGACSFLITTSEGYRIAYTGDMRLHGTTESSSQTKRLIAILKERWVPHVLLCEGTNISEYSRDLEEAPRDEVSHGTIKGCLAEEIGRVLDRGKMVLVDVSANGVDRIDTVYEIVDERCAAGKETTFHLSAYNANVLYELATRAGGEFDQGSIVHMLVTDARVHVYRKSSKDKLNADLEAKLPKARVHLLAEYREAGSALRRDAVMLFYNGDREELFALRPPRGSAYIHSESAPFTTEMEVDGERMRALVEAFGMTHHQIHASGHLYASDIKRMICEVNPQILVPIHTERPELFCDLLEGEGRVRLLNNGEELDLGALNLRLS